MHLPWSAGSIRAACGQYTPSATTHDYDAVTCIRCRGTIKWKERLVSAPTEEQTEPSWLSPEQQAAVDCERNYTRAEVMSFLREGDLSAASFRLQRGFERQVRLAGLERLVREAGEKENA